MIIYLSLFVWVLFFSTVAQRARNIGKNRGKEGFALFMVFAGMVFVYTIRWDVGTDFLTYRQHYEAIGPMTFENVKKVEGEVAFNVLVWFIYQLKPDNYMFYNFVMGTIVYGITLRTIRKETDKLMLTILFYMLICYTYAFNGTRQMIAAMICFAGHRLVREKKYLKFLIVLLIASRIHITVLFIAPFYFLANVPYNNRKLIFIEVVFVISALTVSAYWNRIIEFLSFLGMDKLAKDYGDITKYYGVKIIRIIVKLPVFIVGLINSNVIKKDDKNGDFDFYLNMSIFSLIFTIAGTQMVTLARFSDYFSIYQCLLITKLFKSMEKKNEQVILNACMLAGYILMWIVLLQVESDLTPFRFKNGRVIR